MMRTEYGAKSYIQSDPVHQTPESDDDCSLCNRPPELLVGLRRIEASRNGFQTTLHIFICAACRRDLVHHLETDS